MRGLDIIMATSRLIEGESTQAHALIIMASGIKKSADGAVWESLNTEVATVDSSGVVIGLKTGTARIVSRFNALTASCDIEVVRKINYSRLMISEVYYDAEGSDTGKEFIEVFNADEYSCPVAGIKVIDGASGSTPFVFPEGSVIASGGHVVVASSREGFNSEFGFYPDYSHFTFTLNNSGETVALLMPDGGVIDKVYIKGGAEGQTLDDTWGSSDLPSAAPGSSIFRVNDLDTDTYSDWSCGQPTPGT